MSIPKSPFAKSTSQPGIGEIILDLLPPEKQVLTTFTYQYPLKLIAPDPHQSPSNKRVTVVFLLTYGGGLVGGDKIDLTTTLANQTRLVLLTQGSTKIFKSPNLNTISRQILNIKIGRQSALCYLPDPTQPFAESVYEQRQTFYVEPDGSSNLLLLDWVSEGRRARGESWTLSSWKGRNEVREFDESSRGRLLLRDAVMLHDGGDGSGGGMVQKTNDMGIFGTVIIYGSLYQGLGDFVMKEFTDQPRLGAKNWTTSVDDEKKSKEVVDAEDQAKARMFVEANDGLLWTAARIRGFVLVKFGAKEIDGARRWLGGLLKRDGTVEREFGHQALLCLR